MQPHFRLVGQLNHDLISGDSWIANYLLHESTQFGCIGHAWHYLKVLLMSLAFHLCLWNFPVANTVWYCKLFILFHPLSITLGITLPLDFPCNFPPSPPLTNPLIRGSTILHTYTYIVCFLGPRFLMFCHGLQRPLLSLPPKILQTSLFVNVLWVCAVKIQNNYLFVIKNSSNTKISIKKSDAIGTIIWWYNLYVLYYRKNHHNMVIKLMSQNKPYPTFFPYPHLPEVSDLQESTLYMHLHEMLLK